MCILKYGIATSLPSLELRIKRQEICIDLSCSFLGGSSSDFSAFVGMALANSTASYDCMLTSLPQRIWTIITETGLQTEFALRGRGEEGRSVQRRLL